MIAVSHTVPEESFPERLNKRVPEIRTHKDLSLAVYQSNYLPGLTNGQPTILSSSEIDLEEIVPQQVASREKMSLDLDNDNVFASSPATLSPDVSLNLQSPDRCVDISLFILFIIVYQHTSLVYFSTSCDVEMLYVAKP